MNDTTQSQTLQTAVLSAALAEVRNRLLKEAEEKDAEAKKRMDDWLRLDNALKKALEFELNNRYAGVLEYLRTTLITFPNVKVSTYITRTGTYNDDDKICYTIVVHGDAVNDKINCPQQQPFTSIRHEAATVFADYIRLSNESKLLRNTANNLDQHRFVSEMLDKLPNTVRDHFAILVDALKQVINAST